MIITTFFVIALESVNTLVFSHYLKNKEIPFKQKDLIYTLAAENPNTFFRAEKKGVEHQLYKLSAKIMSFTLSFVCCYVILSKRTQKKFRKNLNRIYTPVRQNFRDLTSEEINLVTGVFTYVFLADLLTDVLYKGVSKWGLIIKAAFIVMGYLYLIPIVLFLSNLLFSQFGAKLIMAAYFSWLMITIIQFSTLEPVDTNKMVKMEIGVFNETIREQLHKYRLHDSVYIERKPSKETNAALVGYGPRRRIEIYGGLSEDSEENLFSVILHEIGHAEDHSLVKKMATYILLIVLEMIIVMFIYLSAAPKFATQNISRFSCFALLFLVYRLFLQSYIFMVFKLVSQTCEINADKFAQKFNYGPILGETLYNIVIDGKEYIKPTSLYTMFTSTHPPIGNRINSLRE